ncbi:MAG: hypothetical protein OXC42_00030 [Gammaproteobacteria bacterium]|nr:hypothetical protein [Gammaproteobacteria bacterium]
MNWREILGVEDTADNSSTQNLRKPSVQPNSEDEPEDTDNPEPVTELSQHEESQIRKWLEAIGETDPEAIEEILDNARKSLDKRNFYLEQSKEAPKLGNNS